MPSIAAISSIVWPSMAASNRTRRNFSGNSARAFSRCVWNSFAAARTSAFAAGGRLSGCDHSVARQMVLLLMHGRKAVVIMCGRKAAGRATWLDQNQLLHLSSCARFECPPSPHLTRRRGPRIGSVRGCRSRCFVYPGLDSQPSEQLFKVGFVDHDFSGWLALRRSLDGAFIESLKEAHLGDGILFAARKRAPVQLGPGVQRGLHDEDLEGESRLPVSRHDVSKFSTVTTAALCTIPLKKIVLVDITASGTLPLDPAYSITASHARIIGGSAGEVNAGIYAPGGPNMKQDSLRQFQNKTKSDQSGSLRKIFLPTIRQFDLRRVAARY